MKELTEGQLIARGLGKRSLVFVGMMGSGKSAIGRMVAGRLGLPYHDSDQEIVAAADMSIAELFEQFGEEYFRRGERRVIERLLRQGPSVISVGGGAFLSEETRRLAREKAISIWLKADLDMLISRVLKRPGTRPLLQTADPQATLARLLAERGPIYAQADLAIESSRSSKKDTCQAVMAGLAEYLGVTAGRSRKEG